MNLSTTCLCTSELEYAQCCQPYHLGVKIAATAEILMRSRFTAYALHNSEYLIQTWDKNQRPKTIDFSKDEAEWQRLEILNTKKGCINDTRGLVTFKAYYLIDDVEHVLHEISRFKKIAGKWLYLDGVVKAVSAVNQTQNQGKNAICACGSGKKFKRCCA